MKPGKIARDIEEELKIERRRKAKALKLKKLHEEYKKRREGASNEHRSNNKETTNSDNVKQ